MQNIKISTTGDTLHFEIDLTRKYGITQSGNIRIASTLGNIPIPGTEGVKAGITVYRKPTQKEIEEMEREK